MAVEKYNQKYLRMKPEVSQLFNDLEEYKDWVRLQYPAIPFDPAELYKNSNPNWQKFMKQKDKKARAKKEELK